MQDLCVRKSASCRSLRKTQANFTEVANLTAVISCHDYRKNPKNSDTQKIAVIILKFEQLSFTIKKYFQKWQMEWQTVLTLIRLLLLKQGLIWVYTVRLNLPVQKLMIITVCKTLKILSLLFYTQYLEKIFLTG